MTKKELIYLLKDFPDDMEVKVYAEDGDMYSSMFIDDQNIFRVAEYKSISTKYPEHYIRISLAW